MILPGLSLIFGELGNVPSVPGFQNYNRTTILAEVRNVLMASKKLLDGVASIIADYRKGEIEPPDADHVNRWISQFDAEVRDPIFNEIQHVLGRTDITRSSVNKFLKGLSGHEKLTNGKPKKFWTETSILKIQHNGSSQKEMLQILGEILKKEHQVDIDASSQDGDVAVYIDDVVFSGGHVRGDLVEWVTNKAPKKVTIHIIVLAYHSGGQWFADQKIQEAAKKAVSSPKPMPRR